MAMIQSTTSSGIKRVAIWNKTTSFSIASWFAK
jgi:hypothetical protein